MTVLHKPPFRVKERGYATFDINVELYFKGLPDNDKAKKVVFKYDLIVAPPFSDVRQLKIK